MYIVKQLEPGKRPLYVITFLTEGDGTDHGTWLITRDKNLAIEYFKWLYEEGCMTSWLDDEGQFYGERNISFRNEDDPMKLGGNWYYSDQEYVLSVSLTTITTDTPWGWNGPDAGKLRSFNNRGRSYR